MPEHTVVMPRMPHIWDDTPFTTSRSAVRGALACWAVKQSPYDVPDNLGHALLEFESAFLSDDYFETSCEDLRGRVYSTFEKCPTIEMWNEAKDGSSGIVFCSRYGQPAPDHDFIDLDALARNVAHLVTLTERYDQIHDALHETEQIGD